MSKHLYRTLNEYRDSTRTIGDAGHEVIDDLFQRLEACQKDADKAEAQNHELKRTAEMNATRIFALTESRNFYEAQCKEMTLRLARIRSALGDEILDQGGVPAEDIE